MVLALGAVGAAAPAAATLTALLSAAPPSALTITLFTAISAAVAGSGIRALSKVLRRRSELAHPGRVALATVCLQAVAVVALDRAAPFRLGLLSLALYSAPALLAAKVAANRSRTVLAVTAAAVVGLALSVPVLGAAQRHWYADQWLATNHIDPLSLVEVIDVPGMRQLPYTYDQTSHQLTAIYDETLDDIDGWFAVETVTVGAADPCGPLTTAHGDALGTTTPDCTPIGGGLWQRTDAGGVEGYVLQQDGVTVTLAGPADGLLAAIEAARPATDADLWRRTTLPAASPIGWLLQ
jgi:hypothetical protein